MIPEQTEKRSYAMEMGASKCRVNLVGWLRYLTDDQVSNTFWHLLRRSAGYLHMCRNVKATHTQPMVSNGKVRIRSECGRVPGQASVPCQCQCA